MCVLDPKYAPIVSDPRLRGAREWVCHLAYVAYDVGWKGVKKHYRHFLKHFA
jgi:hypothetical protein